MYSCFEIYIYMYMLVTIHNWRFDIQYTKIIKMVQSFFPLQSPNRSTSSSSLLCNEKQYSKLHFSHSAHRASKQVFDLLLLVVNGFTRISFCCSHRRAADLRFSSAPILSVAKCSQSLLFAPPLLREGFAIGTTSPAPDTSSTLPSSKGASSSKTAGPLLPSSGTSTTSAATSKALSLR